MTDPAPASRDDWVALANRIGRLGDDLMWVGDELCAKAAQVNWVCAKADRYRSAMEARRTEIRRLAREIWFLAHWAKVQGAMAQETVARESRPGPAAAGGAA